MTTDKNATTARIAAWLALGERGMSSEAIAITTLGAYVTGWRAAWPLDPSDLRRCLLLIEQVPEARELGVDVLARRSPQWAALVTSGTTWRRRCAPRSTRRSRREDQRPRPMR